MTRLMQQALANDGLKAVVVTGDKTGPPPQRDEPKWEPATLSPIPAGAKHSQRRSMGSEWRKLEEEGEGAGEMMI